MSDNGDTADDTRRPSRRRARPRRNRSLTAKLGAVVLGFESVIVFLAGLVMFGLGALPEGIPDWWAIVAGAVVAALMVAATAVLDHTWGIWLGWLLQAVVAAGALLVPPIWFVVLVFGGMWAYAVNMGPRLEARGVALAADAAAQDPHE